MMDEIGMENRKAVLNISLHIERTISQLLGDLLNINTAASKLLSNKSNALSFNTKVLLLLDMKAIDENDKNKLRTFMEIRNQFMHNLDAKSFEECFKFIDGKDNYLKKIYPTKDTLNNEDDLKRMFYELSEDIRTILNKVIDLTVAKTTEIAMSDFRRAYLKRLHEGLSMFKKDINGRFREYLSNNVIVNPQALAVLQSDIIFDFSKRINYAWGDDIDIQVPPGLLDALNQPEG